MSTDTAEESEPQESSGMMMKLLVWLVVATLAVGGGIATPFVISTFASSEDAAVEEESMPEPDPEEEVEFIDFDEVTVNLDEARFSRYLRINFSLQVAKSQRMEIEEKILAKTTIFKNWIQVQVAEKTTEDLRGKYGRNRLRREIHDYINKELFPDGIERIQDVLFREFHVQ
jgi:flagellar basal body-associated protein FliL